MHLLCLSNADDGTGIPEHTEVMNRCSRVVILVMILQRLTDDVGEPSEKGNRKCQPWDSRDHGPQHRASGVVWQEPFHASWVGGDVEQTRRQPGGGDCTSLMRQKAPVGFGTRGSVPFTGEKDKLESGVEKLGC